MPVFNYVCTRCGAAARKLLPKDPGTFFCLCGNTMDRDQEAPTTRSTEVLDNGLMSRPLERLDNAEEIFRDRAHQSDSGDSGDIE